MLDHQLVPRAADVPRDIRVAQVRLKPTEEACPRGTSSSGEGVDLRRRQCVLFGRCRHVVSVPSAQVACGAWHTIVLLTHF